MEETQANSRSGEMRNFGLLLLTLLIVVLVVAFSRPFIFGKVVPAILGEGVPVAPLGDGKEPVEEEGGETAVDDASDDSNNDPEPGENTNPDPYPAPDEETGTGVAAPTEPEALPTSVPTVEHVVQPGDTLTSIANRFNTSIDEIAAANDLVDPNQLRVGATLLIPQPDN